MNPAPQKPTGDTPQDSANAATRPAWRIPPKTAPLATPRMPVSELPSLEALAAVAATLASPAEKPAATARRAMELFAACDLERVEMAKLIEQRDSEAKRLSDEVELVQAFLSSFKTGSAAHSDNASAGAIVTVDEIHEKCMPNAKKEDRARKWRRFIASRLAGSDWFRSTQFSESEFGDLAEIVVTRFREHGFSVDPLLVRITKRFKEFLEADNKAMKADKAAKSKRARIVRPLSRKLLAGEKLNPGEEAILTGLTPAQMEEEIVKLKMTSPQAKRWKAAIEDLKVPPVARPKVKKVRVG